MKFIICRAYAEVTKYYDVWSYEISSDTWTEFTSPSNMVRYMHVAAFDSSTSIMWISAGTSSSAVETRLHCCTRAKVFGSRIEFDLFDFFFCELLNSFLLIFVKLSCPVFLASEDRVDAYWTVPTTTTTTTVSIALAVNPMNATEALKTVEDRQDMISRALLPADPNGTVAADGFTLAEQEDLTLNGTAMISKAMLAPSNGLSFSYQGVTVELPGSKFEFFWGNETKGSALCGHGALTCFDFVLPLGGLDFQGNSSDNPRLSEFEASNVCKQRHAYMYFPRRSIDPILWKVWLLSARNSCRPGALLQTLQDGFALSLALISDDGSTFAFFEEPPSVLASPMVSVQLYTSCLARLEISLRDCAYYAVKVLTALKRFDADRKA